MATFPSSVASGLGLLLSLAAPSANLSAGTADFSIRWAMPSLDGGGTLTSSQPIALTHGASSSAGASSFRDLLYGHIHMFPRELSLGLIVGDQTRSIEIWNARDDSQTLASVLPTNLDGVSWSGDSSPMPAQSSRFWQVTVSAAGAAALDGVLTWSFAAEQPGLAVTGARLVMVALSPNWTEPVSEGIAYRTSVVASRNLREQRAALRTIPRRTQTYTPLALGPQQTLLAHQLHAWAARKWAVPIWQDSVPLGAELPTGAVSISVSTTARDFAVGGLALLWSNAQAWEMVEVQSLTGALLNLVRPTTRTWPAGTRCVPVRPGRLVDDSRAVRHTAALSHWPLNWALDPLEGLAAGRVAAHGLPIYQGYDVLVRRPNADDDLSPSASRALEVMDAEVGADDVKDLSGFETWNRPYTWVLQGHAEFASFLGWLDARRGQAVPFWMPTWTADLEQAYDMASSDTVIRTADTGYRLYVKQHTSRRDLCFWPQAGGAPIFRRITDSTEGPAGTELLTLDSSFGVARPVGSFLGINFLSLVRLDHDGVTVNWVTNELAVVQIRVREVPA